MGRWIGFVGCFSVFIVSDQWLTLQLHAMLSDSQNLSPWLYAVAGLSFLNGLLLPLFASMFFLLSQRAQEKGNRVRYEPAWDELLKEQMRVIGQTVAWGLLFLIPGFVRYFQCLFVPFVVLFDSEYNQGRVDALQRSRQLMGRYWGRVLLWFLVMSVIVPLTLTQFDEQRSFFDSPMTAFGFLLLDVLLFAVFQWGLLKLWERGQNAIFQPQTNS